MLKIFEQLFRLPIAMFTYSVEKFSETLQGMERMLEQSFEAVMGHPAPPEAPATSPQRSAWREAAADGGEAQQTGSSREEPAQGITEPETGTAESGAPNNREERKMADTNLSDDMVKLIEYSIVSLDRDVGEAVVYGPEQIVEYKNLTGDAFSSARIADWNRKDKAGKDWTGDNDDLRVFYNVLDRWPREDLRYEQKQLDRLESIEKAIRSDKDEKGKKK